MPSNRSRRQIGRNIPDARDREGPQLHQAVRSGRLEEVTNLLDGGASYSALDENGHEPLFVACQKGFQGIVELLLQYRVRRFYDEPLCEALFAAVSQGNEAVVANLLSAGANPKSVIIPNTTRAKRLACYAEEGPSPLFVACRKGHTRVVKLLLQHGVQTDCRSQTGNYTPLHSAAESGHAEIASALLEKGANPNAEADGKVTPLHLAAKGGHSEVIERLLIRSAKANAQTIEGSTPLHLVIKHECVTSATSVEILLEFGASVNIKDGENNSALFFAVKKNNHSIVRRILQSFRRDLDNKVYDSVYDIIVAHPKHCRFVDELYENGLTLGPDDIGDCVLLYSAVIKGYMRIVELILNKNPNPKKLVEDSNLLHAAVTYGQLEIIKLFLNLGCCLNARDRSGNTPIHHLKMNYKKSKCAEIVLLLLEEGANVQEATSLLHEALDNQDVNVCEILVNFGADVNAMQDHRSPLHVIASNRVGCSSSSEAMETNIIRGRIFQLLFNNGADINCKTEDGFTALHLAVSNHDEQAVELLVDSGADVNASAGDGSTPLHLAARKCPPQILELLLSNKEINLDPINRDGFSPLQLAYASNSYAQFFMLLHHGADVDQRGPENDTLLHVAIKEGSDYFRYLLANGADVNLEDSSGLSPLELAALDSRRCPKNSEPPVSVLIRHLIALQVAKLHISEKNIRFLEGYESDALRNLHLKRKCEEEVRRMKEERLCGHLSVYNILTNKSNPKYARNESSIQSLEASNFEQYPIYKNLLSTFLRRSKPRLELLVSGQKSLEVLVKTSNLFKKNELPILPSELFEEIVSHLNNKELKLLTLTSQGLHHELRE